LNRRRFLKYAGTTAAAVGASALGLDFLLRPEIRNFNQTVGSELTTSMSSTATAVTSTKTTDLQLRLFHDYHGDGVQQPDEPSLRNLTMEILGSGYRATINADSDGVYWAREIPIGAKYMLVFDDQQFRYLALPNGDFVRTEDYSFVISSDERSLDLGLMEGFLTLPARPSAHFDIDRFYDHDPDPQKYLWWNGVAGYDKELRRGYAPNHPGIDYYMAEGNPLPSPAPGTVDSVGEDEGGKYIFIRHTNDLKTSCGHISSAVVKEGDLIARGQIIALSGKSGKNTELANYPHNHFQLIYHGHCAIDPYSPEFTLTQQNCGYYDASRTDPATGSFPWIPLAISDESLVMPNYWTKKNDPQYALG